MPGWMRAIALAALGGVLPVLAVPALAAPALTIDDFTGACGGVLVCAGAAAESGGALRLTPASPTQSGAAWLPVAFDPATGGGFVSTFRFRMGAGGGLMAADGLAFVLAADPSGLGDPGRYGGSFGYEGVGNSLAVEFDTFDNGGDAGNDNHVALDFGGYLSNAAAASPYGVTDCPEAGPLGCLANGEAWTATVTYDAAAGRISVGLAQDGQAQEALIADYAVDLPGLLGGNVAYAGFSAGTGDGYQNHDLLSWRLSPRDPATDHSVPEPASALALAVALLGLAGARRRR